MVLFFDSGRGIFMTLLQVILLFCLVKDERQEFFEQIYAAPFQGWMWGKNASYISQSD